MLNINNRPIGILDSGIGGLSVLKEIKKLLPNEKIIYFADSKNCPYGTKKAEDVRRITKKIINFLIKKDCKIIVIACNSITSMLIRELRKEFKIPFVGIEPAILMAARATKNGKIGVLATKMTTESDFFKETRNKVLSKIEIEIEIGRGLVELVEAGEVVGKRVERVVLDNLAKFKRKGVDQVVLGCTHYPFLLEEMKKCFPEISFIDGSFAVARQVKNVLDKNRFNNKFKNEACCDVYFSKRSEGMDFLINKIDLKKVRKMEEIEL